MQDKTKVNALLDGSYARNNINKYFQGREVSAKSNKGKFF